MGNCTSKAERLIHATVDQDLEDVQSLVEQGADLEATVGMFPCALHVSLWEVYACVVAMCVCVRSSSPPALPCTAPLHTLIIYNSHQPHITIHQRVAILPSKTQL